MAPPSEPRAHHKTAAVVCFLVAVTMAAPGVAGKRASVMPVDASHERNVTAEDDRILDAIDMCFEKALNASSSAPVVEKFPLFEATLAKSLKDLHDKKYVPKVEAASKVASSAAAAAGTSPDEKFAVYFARLTQVLVGTADAEKHAEKKREAAGKKGADAGTKTAPATDDAGAA